MLSAEIIQQIKQLRLRTQRQVANVLAGEYQSTFRGRGVEFDEVRPYVPGDDVRSIDWNVTARMGEPFIKRYIEERELTLLLMVDVSASQGFGSAARSKREAAVELSALLAFSAIQNNDKVGLLLFHGGAEEYIPPRKGQKHALRIVREVLARGEAPVADDAPPESQTPKGFSRLKGWLLQQFLRLRTLTKKAPHRSTNIAYALEFCRKVIPQKAVIFLISDFLDADYLSALRHTNRRHDVVAVLVTDARELKPTSAGLLTLEDAETGEVRVVDTSSSSWRASAEQTAREHIEALEEQLRISGVDMIHIDATEPVIDPLTRFFRMRQRRLRR